MADGCWSAWACISRCGAGLAGAATAAGCAAASAAEPSMMIISILLSSNEFPSKLRRSSEGALRFPDGVREAPSPRPEVRASWRRTAVRRGDFPPPEERPSRPWCTRQARPSCAALASFRRNGPSASTPCRRDGAQLPPSASFRTASAIPRSGAPDGKAAFAPADHTRCRRPKKSSPAEGVAGLLGQRTWGAKCAARVRCRSRRRSPPACGCAP